MAIIFRRTWNFIGSRNLSVYIFITASVYFFFLLVFGAVVPTWWVDNISEMLPFKVLYLLFLLNLTICEIKWIPVILKRCRKPDVPQDEGDLKGFGHAVEAVCPEAGLQGLEKHLRRRGYKVWSSKAGFRNREKSSDISILLHAYRGRFSPAGNLLFHVSFLFLAAGIFFSTLYRFEGKVLLMEGQEFGGTIGEYRSVVARPESVVPDVSFEVEEISPRFWRNELLFTDLKGYLRHDNKKGIAMLSSPLKVGSAKVTIEGLSYTPKYVLKNLAGRVLDIGYVNLSNFVPGSTDYFKIPNFPYTIYISIFPDSEVKGEKIGTRSMNLRKPICFVRVIRGKVPVYSGGLGPEDVAYFDGLALSFPQIKYNGTFKIVRDPGEWLIWGAFLLMIAGLIWKVLIKRTELLACENGEKIKFYFNSDYTPNLFLERLLKVINSKTNK